MSKLINELSTLSTITGSDQVIVYGTGSSTTGKVSVDSLVTAGGAVMSHDDTAAFIGNTGSETNLFFLQSTLNSVNSTYGGDRAGLIVKPDGLQVWNNTKSQSMWRLNIPVTIEQGGTGAATSAAGFTALSGYTLQCGTNNTTDTWVPVFKDSIIQHRVIPTCYNTSPLAIANGGTGATTANLAFKNMTNDNLGTGIQYVAGLTNNWARTGYSTLANLKTAMKLSCTALWSGGLNTVNKQITFTFGGYNAYIIGGTAGGSSYTTVIIPANDLRTSQANYLISDEAAYVTFGIWYSGSTGYLKFTGKNGSGSLAHVWGI